MTIPTGTKAQTDAEAARRELDAARFRIRQLETVIGMLNREADRQATTITALRHDVEHARSFYARSFVRKTRQH